MFALICLCHRCRRPCQPAQLVEKVQNAVPDELKKSEAEERRNALRIALARRMKQDLLESSTTAEEPNFKFQQVTQSSKREAILPD